MLERTDAIMNEILQPITFVLAYLAVFICVAFVFVGISTDSFDHHTECTASKLP
jgi:hypothetical protein